MVFIQSTPRCICYFLVLLLSLNTADLSACDCDDISVAGAVSNSKHIAIAQVVELLDTKRERKAARYHPRPNESYRVRLLLNQSLKGPLSTHERIELDSDYSDCALVYRKNRQYLLFLTEKGSLYEEQGCTRSRAIEGTGRLIADIKRAVKKGL